MGMSASQVNFGAITRRNHMITRALMECSSQKMSLINESNKVSKEYQEALNSRVLKWSNNSGATYTELSYKNLMHPNEMNQSQPNLITDCHGRVIVDSNYQKYAEMISPDGSAGGDWLSNRTKILAELTGLDPEKIESKNSYESAVIEKGEYLKGLEEPSKRAFTKTTSPDKLLENMPAGTGDTNFTHFSKTSNWADAYRKGDTIDLGFNTMASSSVKNIISNLSKTLAPYFMENSTAFQEACEAKIKEYQNFIENKVDLSNSAGGLQGKSGKYEINVANLIDELLGAAGVGTTHGGYNNQTQYQWYDINSSAYSEWVTAHAQWETDYNNATNDYNNAVNESNQLLTAEEESKIEFYDKIFSAIAEKGWEYNNKVNDTEYLNQMLQNNMYTLTTVERTQEYDSESNEFKWENSYATDIASNNTNIFAVNDSDLQQQARIEYEHKKNIISEKETRIDTRMADLETELSANKQMLESIKQVKKDNIDRNFSIFS